MAKKEEEETTQSFNVIEALQEMEIPNYIISGFLYRIKEKNLTFKSEKDLEKAYDKFMKGV